MKSKKTTIILLISFFVGLSVLLYPTISSYWNSKTQSQAIVDYESMLSQYKPEDYTAIFEQAENYNKKLAELKDPMKEYNKLSEYGDILNIGGTLGEISLTAMVLPYLKSIRNYRFITERRTVC